MYLQVQVPIPTGADPGFSEGGSEHGGGTGSLKQGVWGIVFLTHENRA